jgi:hypothetical protein
LSKSRIQILNVAATLMLYYKWEGLYCCKTKSVSLEKVLKVNSRKLWLNY